MRVGPQARRLACLLTCAALASCGPGNGDADRAAGPEGRTGADGGRVGAGNGEPVRVVDQAGRTLALPRPPRRIVSLVPAATGILVELGLADRLVGRTDFDEAPALAHLPSVGGGLRPSLERLVGLQPELVVRFEGEQDRATPLALDRAGVPHLAVRPDRIDDVREMTRLLGRVSGRLDRAERLVTHLDAQLAEVRERVRGAPRPRVAFLLGGSPPWVATSGTFLHELLEIAGGDNALADAGTLYAPLSVEEIVRREVDLILAPEDARIPSALETLSVVRVPGEVQSPDLELGASARIISRALHPERWP